MWPQLTAQLHSGDFKSIARCISLVENEVEGYDAFLQSLPAATVPVIGITGPPGAGKSTLVDAFIEVLVQHGKKVAVLCVDPSSPFNLGAVLGDRIRMSDWYNHPQVFIRSLATRGSLGGLHPSILEITDVCRAAGFDYVLVETVGVGQSEVEIAGLADLTMVVLVPEAGDEVQTMKAGLMEIADLFVVNKADRPDADRFVRTLQQMLAPAARHTHPAPVVKTAALQKTGIQELWQQVAQLLQQPGQDPRKEWLLAEKAYQLIRKKRMRDIRKDELLQRIAEARSKAPFNLYRFVTEF